MFRSKYLFFLATIIFCSPAFAQFAPFTFFKRGAVVPDACTGKAIGVACDGTTALNAGAFLGGKYMITPSGCTDSTTPVCNGTTDGVQKRWDSRPTTTGAFDVPGVTNHSSASSASTQAGVISSRTLSSLTDSASNGPYPAARYCEDLDYGGFTDWHLPSKTEMAYVYCRASVIGHDVTNPFESPDCTSYGGKTSQLTGFRTDYYWTSTEATGGEYAWYTGFFTGEQSTNWRDNSYFVRCIRRYSGNSIPATLFMPTTLSTMQLDTSLGTETSCQNVTVNNLGEVATSALTISITAGATNFTTTGCTDTCSGQTLGRFASCTVGVKGTSATTGVFTGNLRATATTGGTRNMTLRLVAGEVCSGSTTRGAICVGGSIYAGQYNSANYMITPGGCANSTTPDCTYSTDSLTKSWRGTGSGADIAGVENVTAASTASTVLGDVNTTAAAAVVSADAAPAYCENLNFAGYTDWYLPSKSEMAYIYCRAAVPAHSASNPPDTPNCTVYGGKTSELQHFSSATDYWTSTEVSSGGNAWRISFNNGSHGNSGNKAGSYMFRCVRRF